MRLLALLLSLLAVSVALAGCSGDDDSDGDAMDGGLDGDGMDGDGMDGGMDGEDGMEPGMGSGAGQTMNLALSAEGIYPVNPTIEPATFTVAAGTLVKFTYTNNDLNPVPAHDLMISGVNVQTEQLGPGETATGEFVVDLPPGEYPYWCAVGDHRNQGMEGVMVVTA